MTLPTFNATKGTMTVILGVIVGKPGTHVLRRKALFLRQFNFYFHAEKKIYFENVVNNIISDS